MAKISVPNSPALILQRGSHSSSKAKRLSDKNLGELYLTFWNMAIAYVLSYYVYKNELLKYPSLKQH